MSKDNTCPTCRGLGRGFTIHNVALAKGIAEYFDVCPTCHGSGQQEDKPTITKEQFVEQVKPYTAAKEKQAYLDGYARGYFDSEHNRPNKFEDSKPEKPHDYKNNGLGAEICQRCGHVMSNPDWPPYCPGKEKPLECENCNSTRLVNESVVHNCLDCGYIWSDDRKPPPKEVLARLHKKATQALSSATSSGNTMEPKPSGVMDEQLRKTELAFGGCKKCYGKGYATVLDAWSWHDTDTDIGSPGGRGRREELKIKFCTCDRGKQLEALLATEYDRGKVEGAEAMEKYVNDRLDNGGVDNFEARSLMRAYLAGA